MLFTGNQKQLKDRLTNIPSSVTSVYLLGTGKQKVVCLNNYTAISNKYSPVKHWSVALQETSMSFIANLEYINCLIFPTTNK